VFVLPVFAPPNTLFFIFGLRGNPVAVLPRVAPFFIPSLRVRLAWVVTRLPVLAILVSFADSAHRAYALEFAAEHSTCAFGDANAVVEELPVRALFALKVVRAADVAVFERALPGKNWVLYLRRILRRTLAGVAAGVRVLDPAVFAEPRRHWRAPRRRSAGPPDGLTRELLAGEDQPLLVWRDAFRVLDLGLDVLNRVGRLDGLSGEGFDEDRYDGLSCCGWGGCSEVGWSWGWGWGWLEVGSGLAAGDAGTRKRRCTDHGGGGGGGHEEGRQDASETHGVVLVGWEEGCCGSVLWALGGGLSWVGCGSE